MLAESRNGDERRETQLDTKMKRDLKNLIRMLCRKLTGYRREPAKLANRKSGYAVLGRWFLSRHKAEKFCTDRGMPLTAIQSLAKQDVP